MNMIFKIKVKPDKNAKTPLRVWVKPTIHFIFWNIGG